MVDPRETAEILLDALTDGRTDVIVSDINSDSQAAHNLITKLKANRAVNGDERWRFYQRSIPGKQTVVTIMSPRCKDPAPPTRQALAWEKKKKEQEAQQQKKDHLAEWVLKNLIDPAKLHISVVPAEDIKRLKSASNYETYMTKKVREAMGREDIRVMVREVTKDPGSRRKAYNARIIFGKGKD